jgi:hypothetical protein
MDAQTMLKTAVVLLALTGAGGLLMAGIRFSGKPHPPSWIAMAHGLLAGSGLTLVLYTAFVAGMNSAAWGGLALLVVAALGGARSAERRRCRSYQPSPKRSASITPVPQTMVPNRSRRRT